MITSAPATITRSRRSTVSRALSVIYQEGRWPCRRAASSNASRLIRPADLSIVAVLAGIIPTHAVIAKRIPVRSHGEGQFFRVDRMASVRPHLPTGMHGRQWINGQVQDARNFRRSFLAFNPEGDGYLFHPEVLADQGRERRHWPARGTGEDRPQGFSLLVVSALVDIGSNRPVSFCHRSRRLDCERHVKAIERDAVVPAAFNVEDKRHVADTL